MTYAIEVENLWFKYVGSEDWILKDVSFKIREGETAVIMGPSGCGKSTLLYVLAGMAPRVIKGEMRGCVKIFGREANEMSLSEIARNVAFVFQNPEIQVLMPTVIEVLIFGSKDEFFYHRGD